MVEQASPLKTAENPTLVLANQESHTGRSAHDEQATSEPTSPEGPTYRELKQHSMLLQTNLKELKDNY